MSLGRVSVSSIRFLRLNALSYHFGLHRISGAEPRYSQSINRKWILIPTSNGHSGSKVFDGFQLELTLTFRLKKRPCFIIEILFLSLQNLMQSPLIQDHISFTPFKLYKSAAKVTRIYTEWLSGNQAWESQVSRLFFYI